jgi:hypothetical protein
MLFNYNYPPISNLIAQLRHVFEHKTKIDMIFTVKVYFEFADVIESLILHSQLFETIRFI